MKTKEFLQPNPTARAKMAAVKGISKLSGQAKASTYPQPEGLLGDCLLLYGKKLGDDSCFGKYPRNKVLFLKLQRLLCINFVDLLFECVRRTSIVRIWRISKTNGRC